MPSLVKGRGEEIPKDDQARGPVLLVGSAETGDSDVGRCNQKRHWSWNKCLPNFTSSKDIDREGRKEAEQTPQTWAHLRLLRPAPGGLT